MDRRAFILASAAALAAPLAAGAQPPEKIARIGMLRSEYRPQDDRIMRNIAALRGGLQDEGYAEGQHYRIDYHSPKTEAEVVKLAQALVRDKVDVIHASAYVAISAAQKATQTIPIVAHDYETDPVAAGFVATLARPGGNITGMFLDLPEISGKLLELLKTTLPGLRRIAVLWDPFTDKAQVVAVERAAKTLGVEVQILEARAGTLDQTVRSVTDRKTSALVLLGSPVISAGFPKIADATTANRLPSIALLPPCARVGGLMAYGPDAVDQYRQEGRMIAKILRGTRPADIPVERPTKFYFLINLKTAKALGLTIPPSLLLRADQVVEYVEGRSIAFEARWAEGRVDRLPGLAAELVRLPVNVIVTGGGEAARAAKQATATIPIVMGSGADPVQLGLVASLAHPGGNVTGVTSLSSELIAKRLQLLRELLPKVSRVAVSQTRHPTPGCRCGTRRPVPGFLVLRFTRSAGAIRINSIGPFRSHAASGPVP